MAIVGTGICGAHKKANPCSSCLKASLNVKKRFGRPLKNKKRRQQWAQYEWFDEEKNLVKTLAGKSSVKDITNAINAIRARYQLDPRSDNAVRIWASTNHIELLPNGIHSRHAVQRLFGISSKTLESFVERGLINGRKWGYHFIFFTEEELFNLCTQHSWCLDPKRIRIEKFRTAVQMANRRDPWLNVGQIADLVHCNRNTVLSAIASNHIPYERRTGYNAPYMVRASNVGLIRDILVKPANYLCAYEVRQLLKVSNKTLKDWHNKKYLIGNKQKVSWVYTQDEIHEFIRKYPWLVSAKHLPDSQFKVTLDQVSNANRWVPITKLAQMIPCSPSTIRRYVRFRLIPTRQQYADFPNYLVSLSSKRKIRKLLRSKHNAQMYAGNQVQTLFRVCDETLCYWHDKGYLTGKKWGRVRLYTDAELTRFVQKYPWLISARELPDSKYKTLLEQLPDPWISTTIVAREVNCGPATVRKYARLGLIESKKISGTFSHYVVPRSSIPRMQELLRLGNVNQYTLTRYQEEGVAA